MPAAPLPTIVTDVGLAEIRRFYVDDLGWEVTMEFDTDYLQLRHGGGEDDPELAFSSPAGATPLGDDLGVFDGAGLILSVPVADADRHNATLLERGARPTSAPADMPWGWRSFVVVDPIGIRLDYCHVIEAAPAGSAAQ